MPVWNTRTFSSHTILLISFLSLLAIASTTAATTVTDDMGNAVSINATPQRIISLSPSNTEILFALGLADRVVGVTEYCNYPPQAAGKPKVGGYSTVSIEKVIALKPDLIVASYGNGEELIGSLRSFGYPVIALHPATIAGVLDGIRLVGRSTGEEENATRLIGDLERRISAVQARVNTDSDRPAVAHVIWNDPIYVSGNGTFQDELIRLAGGRNAFSGIEGWKNIGIEDFIQADPDVLIVNAGSGMGGGEDSIAQYFTKEPRFARVPAIRDGRVYIIDSDVVDRAGPRIVDALEEFAGDIHPESALTGPAPTTPFQGVRTPGFCAAAAVCASVFASLAVTRRSAVPVPGEGAGCPVRIPEEDHKVISRKE